MRFIISRTSASAGEQPCKEAVKMRFEGIIDPMQWGITILYIEDLADFVEENGACIISARSDDTKNDCFEIEIYDDYIE